MDSGINSDLIRGHIDTIILKALFESDKYGYDICRDIEHKSLGHYKLKLPTLYSCLKRLERQGLVCAYRGEPGPAGGRRKYYSLTSLGKDHYSKNQSDWEYSRTIIDSLVSNKEYVLENALMEEAEQAYRDEDGFEMEEDLPKESSSSNINMNQSAQTSFFDAVKIQHEEAAVSVDSIIEKPPVVPSIDFKEFLKEKFDSFSGSYSESISTSTNLDIESPAETVLQTQFTPPQSFTDNQTAQSFTETQSTQPFSDSLSQNDDPVIPEFPETENDSIPPIEHEQPHSTAFEFSHTEMKTDPNEFLKFDEPDKSKNYIEKEYKNILSRLVHKEPIIHPSPEPDDSTHSSSMPAVFHKPLAELQLTSVGMDGVRVRPHNKSMSKEYNNLFYVYINKLRIGQYGIIAGLMLVELMFTFLILNFGMGIKGSGIMYILGIVVSALLPITATALYFYNPQYKKRINAETNGGMIFKIFLTVQLIALTICINILVDKNILTTPDNYARIIVPSVLCLNIVISPLIFKILHKLKKYSV